VSRNELTDPYLYPDVPVLKNKFNIKDEESLQKIEGLIFTLRYKDPLPKGELDYSHLKAIHFHFFHQVYEWAGQERTVDIAKGNSYFCHVQYITQELNKLFLKLKSDKYLNNLLPHDFCKKLSFYFNEINAAHPFREGNGRTLRAFCDLVAEQAGYHFDWHQVSSDEYIEASIAGFLHGDYNAMETIFKDIIEPTNPSNKGLMRIKEPEYLYG
jgi:cell filamentation protein